MTRLTALGATVVFVFASVLSSIALAGHVDEFDPCAGLRGSAFGLCTAYAHAMRCSEEEPAADPDACEGLAARLFEATGSPPPSDCPCDFSLERIRDEVQGWGDTASADFNCSQAAGFDPTPSRFTKSGTILLDGDTIGTSGRVANVLIEVLTDRSTASGLEVFFECEYRSVSVGDGPIFDLLDPADLDYVDKVADLIAEFEACEGAIGNLIANTNFGSLTSFCVFE